MIELKTDLSRLRLPCAVQAKYDGEFVLWKDGVLVNRFGRVRKGMPCTKGLDPKLELMGELYWETGKSNFYEGMSHFKRDDGLCKLALFAFHNVDLTFAEQLRLLELLPENSLRKVVETMNAYSSLEVEHIHSEYLKQGFEGSVLKHLSAKTPDNWIKWKPDMDMDLYVLGISKTKSAIAVGRKDGTILGHCSLLGKEKEAKLAIGKLVVTDENKEDYLFSPEVVVEVKHLGVIEKTGRLRSPRISRFREDKR